MTNDFGFPVYTLAGNGQTITVNDGNGDTYGTRWFVEDVEGVDAPDRRAQMLPLVSQEGEVPSDLHYRGRTLVFRNGWAESDSEAHRVSSRLLMQQASDLNLASAGTLTIAEAGVTKQMSVVRFGNTGQGRLKILYKRQGIRPSSAGMAGLASAGPGLKYLLDWQLELYGQNPYWLAASLTTVTVAASMTMTNAGTALAYPTFTIATGGTDPISIANTTTGQTLTLHVPTVPSPPGPLAAMPSNLIINFQTGQITDLSGNSQNYVRELTTGFWALQPGANTVTVTSGGSSVTGSATFRSTWI